MGFGLKIKNRLSSLPTDAPSNGWLSATTTDPGRWDLSIEEGLGRLKWKYRESNGEQSITSRFFLDLPTGAPERGLPTRPSEAVLNGSSFHSRLQLPQQGCWAADLSCIFFVTPMLIFSWYITETELDEPYVIELTRYMTQCQGDDGGWPTHVGGPSTLMGTILVYVALRLMGMSAQDPRLVRARGALLHQGGAVYLPSWAKFWLALLGLYEWEGTDPYPVELWVLPEWAPISPWRWYCIPRRVFLAMSYLSSRQFTVPINPLLEQIREEIFVEPYGSIDFADMRGIVRSCDRHQPKSRVLHAINWVIDHVWNPWFRPAALSAWAEERALDLITSLDRSSHSTGCISVDCFLNMIVFYSCPSPDSKNLRRAQDAAQEYLWMGPRGMQVTSIHSGQTWETAFALQTFVETGLSERPDLRATTERAYRYLIQQQRHDGGHDRLGGWPFGARYDGAACSDCTGESLKAILLVEADTDLPRAMRPQDLHLAVDNLLRIQNPSGGYSTFEPIRGSAGLEHLNGTELFKNVMTEYDWTECTSSCITALNLFRTRDPQYRADAVNAAIDRGVQFILRNQRPDGSWLASWGISCTYGAFFALEALNQCAGLTYMNDAAAQEGCDFLIRQQKSDGGWGETVGTILTDSYVQAPQSHTVQTAWSCLALMYAAYPHVDAIKRGIRLIMSRQRSTGEWPQEGPVGSGITTCEILYHNYIYSFPIRAIAMYQRLYGDDPLL